MATIESTTAPTEAEWLKSPVSERSDRLRPMADVSIEPYHGGRRRQRWIRLSYVIGSADECDIRLDDPFVSPRHAEITVGSDGGYRVRDLDSRNGVFLNGVRVAAAPLARQGVLRMGRSAIAWRGEGEDAPITEDWVAVEEGSRQLLGELRDAARSPLPVLLLGETGTGKDLLARLLHRWSPRARAPYVAVNGGCMGGTLAESELFGHRRGAYTGAEQARLGALRSAHGGTLFLDEVADIPLPSQVKLLRAFESGEVKALGADQPERADFRLVSATSQNLDERLSSGQFRPDLYFRIAGFVLRVPPLRERPGDILAIAGRWLAAAGMELEGEAEGRLLSYRWPGNVRELKSVVDRAIVAARAEGCAKVMPRHLVGLQAGAMPAPMPARGQTLEQMERECILASLERNGWARLVVAEELGIARSTLFEKMKRYGLRAGVSR